MTDTSFMPAEDRKLAKIAYRDQKRSERALARHERRERRRCFWTRPWGHVWGPTDSYLIERCTCCTKTRWVGGDI